MSSTASSRTGTVRGGFAVGAAAAVALTGALAVGGGTTTPAAAADGLRQFDTCEELRQWYVDAALPHVTAWGLGGGGPIPLAEAAAVRDTVAAQERAATTDTGVGGSATGTNVQEAGVDEPDLVKTDGSQVVHLHGRRLTVTDVTGSRPQELAELRLPRGLVSGELLLVGDRVVVLGTGPQVWAMPMVDARDVDRRWIGPPPVTDARMLVVDIADPTEPRVVHDATLSGSVVSARQYGETLRVVLSTTTPALDFVHPRRGRDLREARRENRRIVRDSDIDDWLPTVEAAGSTTPLVGCDQVRHPRQASGYGTMTVLTVDPADPGDRRTTAVTTSSDLVYSSADRLYLATAQRRGTGVHAFALEGLETRYVASGRVPGSVRDRWSLDEYDGHLRVATALGNPWNPRENAVVVLAERGTELVEVGRVGDMGIREQVQSVRWFDDVAVVVTFRQVDPLYTVDLSDPTRPRVPGELKIPGFSSYLHPVGDDLLVGLGQDADLRGRTKGAQASVFDLGDLADPERVATLSFGRSASFVAGWDPRSVTYLPERRLVLAVLEDWRGGARVARLRVSPEGDLVRLPSLPVPGRGANAWQTRTVPLPDGRLAVVSGERVSLAG